MMKKRFLLKLSNESLLFISTCWLVLLHWLFFAGDVIVGFLNNTVFQRHVFVFDLASLSLCEQVVHFNNKEFWVGFLKNAALVVYSMPEIHFFSRLLLFVYHSVVQNNEHIQVPLGFV